MADKGRVEESDFGAIVNWMLLIEAVSLAERQLAKERGRARDFAINRDNGVVGLSRESNAAKANQKCR